jgi:hypothetical protein
VESEANGTVDIATGKIIGEDTFRLTFKHS